MLLPNVELNLKIILNNEEIKKAEMVKYLGVLVDSKLKWANHINHLSMLISRNIGIINRVKLYLDKKSLLLLYNSLVLPYINYCCVVWGFTFHTYVNKIDILQKRIIRIIDNQPRLAHSEPIFKSLQLLKVKDFAKQQLILIMHRHLTGNLPTSMLNLFSLARQQTINMRNRRHFQEIYTAKLYRTRTVSWYGPRLWNEILSSHFSITELANSSKEKIKKHVKLQFINGYID